MFPTAVAGLQLSLVQVDALLSETGVLPDEATACKDTISALSEVLLSLPDMQVGPCAGSPDLHCQAFVFQQQ